VNDETLSSEQVDRLAVKAEVETESEEEVLCMLIRLTHFE